MYHRSMRILSTIFRTTNIRLNDQHGDYSTLRAKEKKKKKKKEKEDRNNLELSKLISRFAQPLDMETRYASFAVYTCMHTVCSPVVPKHVYTRGVCTWLN